MGSNFTVSQTRPKCLLEPLVLDGVTVVVPPKTPPKTPPKKSKAGKSDDKSDDEESDDKSSSSDVEEEVEEIVEVAEEEEGAIRSVILNGKRELCRFAVSLKQLREARR